RSFYIGEEDSDFVLPAGKVGASRRPIVLKSGEGEPKVVLPLGAKGRIRMPGPAWKSLADAIATNMVEPCIEVASAHLVSMPVGTTVEMEIEGIVFEITSTHAGRRVRGGFGIDKKSLPYQGLSFLLHVGLLAVTAV